MKGKILTSFACVICMCFLLVGCAKGLSENDFINAYNNTDKGTEFTKVVSFMTQGYELYDSQTLIVGEKDGKKMLTLKTTTKELNELSFEDTDLYKITETTKYYFDGKIGESVNGEVNWRDGLASELTGEWSGTKTPIKANYFEKITIDKEKNTFSASVKSDYYSAVLFDGVNDLSVVISLNQDKTMSKAEFTYIYKDIEYNIDFSVKY